MFGRNSRGLCYAEMVKGEKQGKESNVIQLQALWITIGKALSISEQVGDII